MAEIDFVYDEGFNKSMSTDTTESAPGGKIDALDSPVEPFAEGNLGMPGLSDNQKADMAGGGGASTFKSPCEY